MMLWKKDQLGCNSYRQEKLENLVASKENFLRLSEMVIVHSLGKPDRVELIEKSQKIYEYYLEPNFNCISLTNEDSLIKTAQIRFNAMGYSNSFIVTNNLATE